MLTLFAFTLPVLALQLWREVALSALEAAAVPFGARPGARP